MTIERITTAEFYDRYLTGELDSPFAMAWASYYEIVRDCGRGMKNLRRREARAARRPCSRATW